MRRSCTFVLIALGLVCLHQVVAQDANSARPGPSTSLSIGAVQDSVKVGSPVALKVICKNTSNHDIKVVTEIHNYHLKVDVRDAKGNLVPDTPLGSIWNGHGEPDMARITPEDLKGNAVYGTLKPGESSISELNVAKRYELSRPGKYTIQVQIADFEDPSRLVKSNTITVTLIP